MEIQSGGVSALTVLGIVFLVLKIVSVITWSWWFVLMPFWGPLVLLVLVLLVVFLSMVITEIAGVRR